MTPTDVNTLLLSLGFTSTGGVHDRSRSPSPKSPSPPPKEHNQSVLASAVKVKKHSRQRDGRSHSSHKSPSSPKIIQPIQRQSPPLRLCPPLRRLPREYFRPKVEVVRALDETIETGFGTVIALEDELQELRIFLDDLRNPECQEEELSSYLSTSLKTAHKEEFDALCLLVQQTYTEDGETRLLKEPRCLLLIKNPR